MPQVMERRMERRAVQRHVLENPFNFEEIEARLLASVQKRIKDEGIRFEPKGPKYASKWADIAKNIAHPMDNVFGKNTRNFRGHKWYPIRPLKLADAMGSTKKAGIIRVWKDKRDYKRAVALNERFEPRAAQMTEEFITEANAALAELQNAVREGRVNRENRNFYFEKYEKAVREAEIKFQQSASRLISDYMKEWKKK